MKLLRTVIISLILLLFINVKSNGQTIVDFNYTPDTIEVGQNISFKNLSTGVPANSYFVWKFVKCSYNYYFQSCNDTTTNVSQAVIHSFDFCGIDSVTLKLYDVNNNLISTLAKAVWVVKSSPAPCMDDNFNPCKNLICNGDFEYSNITVTYMGSAKQAYTWNDYTGGVFERGSDLFMTSSYQQLILPDSIIPIVGVPNNYLGYRDSRIATDSNYAGIATKLKRVNEAGNPEYREYLTQDFNTSYLMQPGQKYVVGMWVSIADNSHWAMNNLGMYFYDYAGLSIQQNFPSHNFNYTGGQPVTITPQVKNTSVINSYDWVLISDTITVPSNIYYGGVIIGNFDSEANTTFNIVSNATAYAGVSGQYDSICYYYIDDVFIKPLHYNTSYTDTICLGETVCLTSPASDDLNFFLWNSGQETRTICVHPNNDSTYICYVQPIGTDTLCYTSDTFNIKVIHPIPIISTSSNYCLGDSITFTGSALPCENGITDWSWNFGNGTVDHHSQNTTYSYPVAGTYTVTLIITDISGDTHDTTMQITINGPINLQVTGPNNSCDSITYYKINNYLQQGQYFWRFNNYILTPINDSIFYIPFADSAYGNIFIQYTSTNGCRSFDTIEIFPCCVNGSTTMIHDLTISSGGTLSSDRFVNGTIVIDANYTVQNAILSMGPEAKIIVNPPYQLKLINVMINSGCKLMWDGIYIKDSNAVLVDSATSVNIVQRDAYNTVVSENGGKFRLRNINFYNNLTSVLVKNHFKIFNNKPHKGIITGCTFKKDGTGLIAPHAGEKPKYGFYVDNAYRLTIGDSTNANYKNTFSDIFCGIYSTNSTTSVYNCSFKNIKASGYCVIQPGDFITLFCETAIHSVATTNDHTHFNYSQLSCGGACANSRDSIYNCSTGIYSYKTLTKINNIKVRATTTGVFCQDATSASYVVNSTFKNNTPTGIKFINTVPTIGKLTIKSDTILDPTNGIYLSNAASSTSTKTIVCNNYITSVKNTATYGIRLEKCDLVEAYCNMVYRTTIPSSTLRTYIRGIRVEQSANALIRDNTSQRIGLGIYGAGSLLGTKFKCNTSDGSYNGFYFDASYSAIQTALSSQGTLALPNDNKWQNLIANYYKIEGNYSTPQIFWYYRNSNPTLYMPTLGLNVFGVTVTSSGNPVQTSCTSCNGSLMMLGLTTPEQIISSNNQPNELTAIIDETNNYNELDEQFKYFEKQYAFNSLNSIPSLINAQTGDFFNELNNGNIGSFDKVFKFAQNEDFENAKIFNEQIAPINNIETNRKWVNDVYLNYVVPQVLIPQNIIDELVTLASLSPFVEGDAVYTARAIVHFSEFEYNNKNVEQSDNNQENVQNQNTEINDVKVIVYPNPANDYFTVEIIGNYNKPVKFVLMNTTGVNVYEEFFNAKLNKIDTKQFKQGVYLYKVLINNNEGNTEQGRIIIIR